MHKLLCFFGVHFWVKQDSPPVGVEKCPICEAVQQFVIPGNWERIKGTPNEIKQLLDWNSDNWKNLTKSKL